MLRIGPYQFQNPLGLAPMAGVTDRPFRLLCKQLGAGFAVSEMTSSNPQLRCSRKTMRKLDHSGEVEPKIVQIVGGDPQMMAETARYNADQGAHIIDINMGCPAKKICNKKAGSALMADEILAARILHSVVDAVSVPVTLKMRTGPHPGNRNAIHIATIAEDAGIQAIAIHGRTRADGFNGIAEYETIAEIKSRVGIPVLANGDITTPEKAKTILDTTKVDGLLIGRAAQGNPWIFREIDYYIRTETHRSKPTLDEIRDTLLGHIKNLYTFYGEYTGIRIARKHISWYLQPFKDINKDTYRNIMSQTDSIELQILQLTELFAALVSQEPLNLKGKIAA